MLAGFGPLMPRNSAGPMYRYVFQTFASAAKSAGSLCTGITHNRCPPGARST